MEAASQMRAPFIFATQVEHVCPMFKVRSHFGVHETYCLLPSQDCIRFYCKDALLIINIDYCVLFCILFSFIAENMAILHRSIFRDSTEN